MNLKSNKSRSLNSFIPGEVDIIIIPVSQDGNIISEKLRAYVQKNLWDSALESRIQGIIGQFREGQCYLYENELPRIFRAQIYVPESAEISKVFDIIHDTGKYAKVAVPSKEGKSIYNLIGVVPRNITCMYYQM